MVSFEALGILNQNGVPRHLPKHSPLQLVSSQFGKGECVWLSVGLCPNDAATRAAFGPHRKNACLTAGPDSIWPDFYDPIFGPAFGSIFRTTKKQTGAVQRAWWSGFNPFAGASLSSVSRHGHASVSYCTLYYNYIMDSSNTWVPLRGIASVFPLPSLAMAR